MKRFMGSGWASEAKEQVYKLGWPLGYLNIFPNLLRKDPVY